MKFLCAVLFLMSIGCGVKGDPVPPEDPAYIGRGKPSFKKAVERVDIRTEALDEEKESKDEDDEADEQ